MKLLLTSQGFTNQKIIDALQGMLDRPISESSIAVIPTASLYSTSDKAWWVDVMKDVRDMNWRNLDIVDMSAQLESNWLPRINDADVLFFTGDNTMHLMKGLDQSGLGGMLYNLAQTKVIVGNSAGNAVLGPDLQASNETKREEYARLHQWEEPQNAYALYDFYVSSHFNSSDFPRTEADIKKLAESLNRTLYAIDDQSAIVVIDGEVESVVGIGEHLIIEQ